MDQHRQIKVTTMHLPRRTLLSLAAGAAALPAVSRNAAADDYPSRPVRILVGFPAGGTTDIIARLIGQPLTERFGQPFVTDNRPGANTNIAASTLAHAAPDGYTLMIIGATNTINASLYTNLNFDLVRDFAMVAGVTQTPMVLEVIPSLPVTTVPEFIAYAKAHPGKVMRLVV